MEVEVRQHTDFGYAKAFGSLTGDTWSSYAQAFRYATRDTYRRLDTQPRRHIGVWTNRRLDSLPSSHTGAWILNPGVWSPTRTILQVAISDTDAPLKHFVEMVELLTSKEERHWVAPWQEMAEPCGWK